MELKQLKYFMIDCEKRVNKTAEWLYTTQPNVSKVINSLEKELGRKLFERTNRGLTITPYGETLKEYAHIILKNMSEINSMIDHNHGKKFSVSTYSSNTVSRLLADFYTYWNKHGYVIEHQEGSVEEVSDLVSRGISEIGIVYLAQKQMKSFQHIMGHKKLVFEPLDVKEVCVYAGPKNHNYDREGINFDDLHQLRFVREVRDYFSMEHHLEHLSLGVISTEKLNFVMYTNINHDNINVLLNTDICSLGINFLYPKYKQYHKSTENK